VAKKSDKWMPLYIADYLRDTMHLTREQHGGYLLLIMACWDRGGRLPADPGQLAGIAKATPSEWRKLAPILLPFFEREGDLLIQRRVLAEYEHAAKISAIRSETGAAGGRPRTNPESKPKPKGLPNEDQTGLQTETHARVASPSPSTSPSEDKSSSGGPRRGFRLPVDWEPSEVDLAYAASNGFGRQQALAIAERFSNYWRAKAGQAATKLDWAATWRNWILEEADRRAPPLKKVGFV
jgi:uncharacterized protein YdaU (DUF1376 family)